MTDPANTHPRSELSAYLDDQLGVDERAAVDRHLASCEECRAELGALRSLAEAVGVEQVPPVPADLAARIGRRIDAATVVRFPKRRFVLPATIAATLGAIGLLVAIQWREGRLGAPAHPAPQELDMPADESPRVDGPPLPATTEDNLAARQARPEKEADDRERKDKDVKRSGEPVVEERFKQKKDEAVQGAVEEGVPGGAPRGVASGVVGGVAEGVAVSGSGAAPADGRRDQELSKVMNEQAAGPSTPTAVAPTAPAPAAKAAAVSSCAERWSDSGLRASWDVADVKAAQQQLGRIAHAVAGVGLWRGVADGRPYVVVVPRERFDEVFYALRARGVLGLDEPPALPEGTDCVGISVALTGAASPKPRRPRRSRTVRRDRRRRAAPTPAPSL